MNLPLFRVSSRPRAKSYRKVLVVLTVIGCMIFFYLYNNPLLQEAQLKSDTVFDENNELNNLNDPIDDPINLKDEQHLRIHSWIRKPVIAPPSEPKQKPHKSPKNEQNDENKQRQQKIREMMLLAWNGYKKFAWGSNELSPIAERSHLAGIFGAGEQLGATIVDSLDTLHLMGLHSEVELGKEWVSDHFDMNINSDLSAFEINIRFLGGFLTMYDLTQDKIYLKKAENIAELMMPIFDTPTGIPLSLFNPKTGHVSNYNWAVDRCSILAEFGSLSLEWQRLSDVTGKVIYADKIQKIFEVMERVKKPYDLFYTMINPNSGQWCTTNSGMGGLADSFYEYLIKLWLYKNKSDDKLLKMYLDAMRGVKNNLLATSENGMVYLGEISNGHLHAKMGHLACFSGGMFALTAMYVPELSSEESQSFKSLAINVTNTCHESYARTRTHLGSEDFNFMNTQGPVPGNPTYILRPEVVESYFYLWRMTKDNMYREWAWEAVLAIEEHCKTPNGYTGIRDVNADEPEQDDVQQSFFLAETLKYLYLIFGEDSQLPLDEYVFNTEAHPFKINKNYTRKGI